MIAVYADETGTGGVPKSGKEPSPGMYGFLATPEMWEIFRKDWKAKLDEYCIPYFHFRELHPSERTKPKSPYHGWSNDRVDDFIHEMAIVASSGPIPFGGNASVKMIFGKSPTKVELNKIYKKAFYRFFSDFKATMNDHFPGENEKASFFFSDIRNKEWILILSQVIKDARSHDSRIGECSFISDRDYRGSPCQAADLFAYINRQNSANIYDAGHNLPLRILDLIIGRCAFTKSHPGYELRTLKNEEWRELIEDMRKEKRDFEISRVILGEPKQEYYPTLIHPFFKKLFSTYKTK
jgi:hypothetical protein